MKSTSAVGNKSLGHVLAALLSAGYNVLLPFGDGFHYDLAFDNGTIKRVQCKTGKLLRNGTINFRNYTVLRDGSHRRYGDTVDFYGVFCPQNGKVYLVPSAECANEATSLRVAIPKLKGNHSSIRWATKYEVLGSSSGQDTGLPIQ